MNYKLILLAVLVVLVGLYQYFSLNPMNRNTIEHEIEDICGPGLNNAVMHTIPDDSICRAECLNYCRTLEREFEKAKFKEYDVQCNICTCFCR